jgi:hypothetical protein
MPSSSIIPVTDDLLASHIRQARKRVVLITPGVWPPVAEAIADAWRRLPPEQVVVILDIDPEVFRIGYGSMEALETVSHAAAAASQAIAHEPGVRICVCIVDDQTIISSPSPRQVEAPSTSSPGDVAPPPGCPNDEPSFPDGGGSESTTDQPFPLPQPTASKPNGIILGPPPEALEREIGDGPAGVEEQTLGMDHVDEKQLDKVKEDLARNPPKNFDLARAVNVYNAKVQFVELKVAGCKLSQAKSSLPKMLMHVLKNNPELDKKIDKSIKLLDADDELISGPGISQISISAERKRLEDEYLHVVEGVGKVIERSRKKEFIEDLKPLKKLVEDFSKDIEGKLAERFENTAHQIAAELLDEVLANPPEQWRKRLGPHPDRERVRFYITEELLDAFGTPAGKVGKMKVSLVYKDVTYDMLKDPEFQMQMERFFPDLPPMDEYRAAREREEESDETKE